MPELVDDPKVICSNVKAALLEVGNTYWFIDCREPARNRPYWYRLRKIDETDRESAEEYFEDCFGPPTTYVPLPRIHKRDNYEQERPARG